MNNLESYDYLLEEQPNELQETNTQLQETNAQWESLCNDFKELHKQHKELEQRLAHVKKLMTTKAEAEGIKRTVKEGVLLELLERKGAIEYKAIPEIAMLSEQYKDAYRKAPTKYWVIREMSER